MTITAESDPRTIEIRLVALGDEFLHTTNLQARKDISTEYRRLRALWVNLKSGGGA